MLFFHPGLTRHGAESDGDTGSQGLVKGVLGVEGTDEVHGSSAPCIQTAHVSLVAPRHYSGLEAEVFGTPDRVATAKAALQLLVEKLVQTTVAVGDRSAVDGALGADCNTSTTAYVWMPTKSQVKIVGTSDEVAAAVRSLNQSPGPGGTARCVHALPLESNEDCNPQHWPLNTATVEPPAPSPGVQRRSYPMKGPPSHRTFCEPWPSRCRNRVNSPRSQDTNSVR